MRNYQILSILGCNYKVQWCWKNSNFLLVEIKQGCLGMVFRNIFGFLICLLLLSVSQAARADCASPAGQAGTIIFNSAHKVMQYCNGEVWVGLWGGGGSADLTNLDAGNLKTGIADPERLGTGTPNASMVLRGNGAWGAELDPKVGAVTSGRLCRGSGSQVICDQTAPSSGFTNTVTRSQNVSCGTDQTCNVNVTCPAAGDRAIVCAANLSNNYGSIGGGTIIGTAGTNYCTVRMTGGSSGGGGSVSGTVNILCLR